MTMGRARTALSNRYKLVRLRLSDSAGYSRVQCVRNRRLTYLSTSALLDLYWQVRGAELSARRGVLIEAGVALGGSAIVMASAKAPQRHLFLYDTFGMIPPPSGRDGQDAQERYHEIAMGAARGIRGDAYYGYEDDLLPKVRASFASCSLDPGDHNVRFVQGLYKETLTVSEPVALAHVDSDWYDSVLVCLERIVPYLVKGGVLIIDDYEEWSGCRRAVDEYFRGRRDGFEFQMKSRLHIVRC
jgi:asparagine synthase (glutamine-hydrolysing)